MTSAAVARPTRRWLWLTAVAIPVAAIVIAVIESQGPSTFVVNGSIGLTGQIGTAVLPLHGLHGSTCQGTGGYSDLVPGTAVLINDPQGKTVSTGALTTGRFSWPDTGNAAACTFDFSVFNVPAGLASYSVTISHRGTQVFTPEQARSGGVTLSIGE